MLLAARTAALHAQSGDLRVTMVTPLGPLPACSAVIHVFLPCRGCPAEVGYLMAAWPRSCAGVTTRIAS